MTTWHSRLAGPFLCFSAISICGSIEEMNTGAINGSTEVLESVLHYPPWKKNDSQWTDNSANSISIKLGISVQL
jgi:hypothetical protein